jgi:excisionase family DNA binding protein
VASSMTEYNELIKHMTPVTAPTEQRVGVAALHSLVTHQGHDGAQNYKLVAPDGEESEMPPAVLALLERVIEVLASGDALTIVPVGKELTTQQCANILNVSRQYVVQLLDSGHIPYRKTGTHRRVKMEDLLAYKRQRDRARSASLEELTRLTEAFGGYDELEDVPR